MADVADMADMAAGGVHPQALQEEAPPAVAMLTINSPNSPNSRQ